MAVAKQALCWPVFCGGHGVARRFYFYRLFPTQRTLLRRNISTPRRVRGQQRLYIFNRYDRHVIWLFSSSPHTPSVDVSAPRVRIFFMGLSLQRVLVECFLLPNARWVGYQFLLFRLCGVRIAHHCLGTGDDSAPHPLATSSTGRHRTHGRCAYFGSLRSFLAASCLRYAAPSCLVE